MNDAEFEEAVQRFSKRPDLQLLISASETMLRPDLSEPKTELLTGLLKILNAALARRKARGE